MSREHSFAKRHEIALPKELALFTARIDRRAIAQLDNADALVSLCIPWRLEGATLVLLLPEDCIEEEWHSLVSVACVQLAKQPNIEALTFRSSGLPEDHHTKVLDFFYQLAESNISCVDRLEFVCPLRWEELRPTDDPYRRDCPTCHRAVHLVTDEQEFENRAQTGECVAYPALTSRHEQDLDVPLMLGRPLPFEQRQRARQASRERTYGAISLEDYLASVGDHGDAEAGEDPRS